MLTRLLCFFATTIILLLANRAIGSLDVEDSTKSYASCIAEVNCEQLDEASNGVSLEGNSEESIPVHRNINRKHAVEEKQEEHEIFDENFKDMNDECESWASRMECDHNPSYMHEYCKKSCGICLAPPDLGEEQLSHDPDTAEVIQRSIAYLKNEVMVKPEYANIRYHCQNRHRDCSYWASINECEANPTYMHVNCALACQTCLKIDMEQKCPIDNTTDVLYPGDLNKLFENIVEKSIGEESEFAKFKPMVLSRPSMNPSDEGKEISYQQGPWVIIFDNFLNDEECDRLIDLGHQLNFTRSSNVGKLNFDGTVISQIDDSRTSQNTFCTDFCFQDPLVVQITERIEKVTGIPEKNQEHLQILKYQVGEYYEEHHDFIPHLVKRQAGPRVLTFFLYLNDVEEGGGTRFPLLDLTVMPKKGKALLWPNVPDSNANVRDDQTKHEALPVEKGIKYGANAWIHLRDFKTPYFNGCL